MLTQQDKDDIKDIVVDVIKDVVLPAFETVALKTDLDKVERKLDKRLGTVETRLNKVEMKLDNVVDNQIVDKQKYDDHEKRIKKLESRRAVAV